MKRIFNLNFCFFALLIFISPQLFSQDFIITLKDQTISCDVQKLVFSNDKFHITTKEGTEKQINLLDAQNLTIKDGKINRFIYRHLSFDTISCEISSINESSVFYQEDNILKSIDKSQVFTILCSMSVKAPNFKRYEKEFLLLHKSLYKDELLLTKEDGETTPLKAIHSIDNSRIYFTILQNEKQIDTYLDIFDIRNIDFKSTEQKNHLAYNNTFILSKKNVFYQVNAISNFSDSIIQVELIRDNNILNIPQDKASTAGIFFLDFENTELLKTNQLHTFALSAKAESSFVKFDFSGGFGYRLGKVHKNIDKEIKEVIDNTRLGSVFNGKLLIYTTPSVGFGVMFNHYHASYSAHSISDDVKTSFVGLSFTTNSNSTNNRGYIYSSITVGYAQFKEHISILDESVLIKGGAPGAYTLIGFDILLNKNIAVGINSGILLGNINEFKVDNQSLLTTEAESLFRFDGTVGIKFYLD